MAFPFHLTFEESLQISTNEINEYEIFRIIENYLLRQQQSDFYKTDNTIILNPSGSKTSRFGVLGKCEFIVIETNKEFKLVYKFSYTKPLLIFTIFLLIALFTTKEITFIPLGIIVIIGSTLISVYHQNTIFYEIINEINPKFIRKS